MTSIECTDIAAWEENTLAASNEGYDLIIGIGWQAADPFSDVLRYNFQIQNML